MAKTIENLFFNLVFVFDFLLVIYIIVTSQKRVKNQPFIWLILGYCCLNSICNFFQSELPKNIEYLFLVLFTFAEYLVFAFFFKMHIKSKNFHKLMLLLTLIFSIIAIFNYDSGKSQKIDSVPIGVETILILIFSFYYLYEQMNILDDSFIYSRYHFWVVLAMMIYLGGSFFIYTFANLTSPEVMDNYWFLSYVFYIIKNIFFGVGIFMYSKSKSNPKSFNKFHPYLNKV